MPPTADNPMSMSPIPSFLLWLRLTRPWNVLAMGSMVALVLRWQGYPMGDLLHSGKAGWVVVPMLVGAAGNLINDYFDVREDRINKPQKAFVGRGVKRRVVMVTHWGFSLVACGWGAWLSHEMGSAWPVATVAVLTAILWMYSPLLKGRGAWGNVAISLCVASLVLWGGLLPFVSTSRMQGLSIPPLMLASILGALNFLREWVKDLQDIHGDRAANHRTMASRLSPTQNRVGLMVGASLTTAFSLGWMAWQAAHWGCLVGTAVAGVACTWLASRGNHRRLSAWMKLWMGLLFWPLL